MYPFGDQHGCASSLNPFRRDARGNYVCRWDDCRKVFEKKKMYMKHIYLIHEGGNEKQKLKKICDICGNLVTANNMKQHVRYKYGAKYQGCHGHPASRIVSCFLMTSSSWSR